MAESAHPEGWQVPGRAPLIAALGVLAVTLALLLIAGWVYHRTIAAERRQPVHSFPAPGVETQVHDGARDPPLPPPVHRADPAIEAAKRDTLAHGLAGWPG